MIKLNDSLAKLHRKVHTLPTDAERQKLYAVLDQELQKQFPETVKYHYTLKLGRDDSYIQIDRHRHRPKEVKKISKSDQDKKKN